ncbi:hypothetical protein THRCLA_09883 [Thraustotheca clavata]|uniref:Uncharacterized protein n=1 Tax=Thraustotheca clavata TaxID=74557 RepID=A0A1V9YU03_9STRA|nr:hypothetical protein THRCLA_09883 [Thraustotheca clavata]
MDAIFLMDIGINMNIAFYKYNSKDEQRTLTLKYSSNTAAKDKYLVRDRKKIFITYAKAALMGQDLFPVYTGEMIYLAFASIVSSVTIATVFGDVSILVSSLYADSTKYREKMEEVYESMQFLGLLHEVQQRVHLYYTYLWEQYHTFNGRSAPVVSELSTNLQREIMPYLNAILSSTRDHPRSHGMGVDKTVLKMLWHATSCLHDVTSRVAKMEKSINKLTKAIRQTRVPQQGRHHHPTTHQRPSINLPRSPSMQRRSSLQSDASFVMDSETLNHAHYQLEGSFHLHKRRYSFLKPDTLPKHPLINNDVINDEKSFEVPTPNTSFDTFDDDDTLEEQILQNLDDVEQVLMNGLDDIAEEKDTSQRKQSKKSSS